jgi:hypothetical protein
LTFFYAEISDAFDGGFNSQLWEPWVWAFTALYSIALLAPVVIFWWHLSLMPISPLTGCSKNLPTDCGTA